MNTKSNILKILIIGDLHGSIPQIHLKDFDLLIAPGDFCGDKIRKYIKLHFNELEKGNIIDFEQICPIKTQEKLDKESIEEGEKVLSFLNSINKPIILVPGNWDPTLYSDGIKKKEEKWMKLLENKNNLIDIEHKKTSLFGYDFIGHGSTSAPEILNQNEVEDSRDEKRYNYFKKINKKLNTLFQKSLNPVIFISHNVPYNTTLDKIKSKNPSLNGKHYGSKLARKLIERHQPLLCVGGHIHEGRGKTYIGNTVCINSGFGSDVNTYLEIDKEKKKIITIKEYGENKNN